MENSRKNNNILSKNTCIIYDFVQNNYKNSQKCERFRLQGTTWAKSENFFVTEPFAILEQSLRVRILESSLEENSDLSRSIRSTSELVYSCSGEVRLVGPLTSRNASTRHNGVDEVCKTQKKKLKVPNLLVQKCNYDTKYRT